MLKRKMFWLAILAAGGLVHLGINCFPEPDLSFNLLGGLFTTTAA